MQKAIEAIIYAIKIIALPLTLLFIWIRNFLTKIRYKRGRITKLNDFEIKRCLENKNKVYIIVRVKYHHVVDPYTLEKLGWELAEILEDNDLCFSKSEYEKNGYRQGRDIQIYNLGEFRKNYLKVFEK